jgi:hypothetical protein
MEDAFWKLLYGTADPRMAVSKRAESAPGGPGSDSPAAAGLLTIADRGSTQRPGTPASMPEDRGPREINVVIDRVDVRGIAPPAPAEPSDARRRGPRLTLAEYVRQQGRGRR